MTDILGQNTTAISAKNGAATVKYASLTSENAVEVKSGRFKMAMVLSPDSCEYHFFLKLV